MLLFARIKKTHLCLFVYLDTENPGILFQCIDVSMKKIEEILINIENRVNYPGKASLLKGPMIIRNVLFLLFMGGRRLCY